MEGQIGLFESNQEVNKADEIRTLDEKIEESKRILRLAAKMSKTLYNEPLIVCYSMGKDSDVLLHLARTTLQPSDYEVLNSHTSVDYPESIYHRREVFAELEKEGVKTTVIYPKDKNGNHITMWNLILKRNRLPTRIARHCCAVLKETSTPNRLAAMGVRAAESIGRRGKDVFQIRGETKKDALFYSYDHAEEVFNESLEIQDDNWDCTLIRTMKEHKDTTCHPIYYWSDDDVWDYIRRNNIKTNPLYEQGLDRIGCILCPMASYRQKQWQIAHYPQYKAAYIHACDMLLEKWKKSGKKSEWSSGEEMFWWWIEEGKRQVKGQLSLFDKQDTNEN